MNIKKIAEILVLSVILLPRTSRACATCFGASDAAATLGMNWAIFTLLGVIVSLMICVVVIIFKMNIRAKNLSVNYE